MHIFFCLIYFMSSHGLVYHVQAKLSGKTSYVNRNRLYQFAFHLGQQWLCTPGVPPPKRVSKSTYIYIFIIDFIELAQEDLKSVLKSWC